MKKAKAITDTISEEEMLIKDYIEAMIYFFRAVDKILGMNTERGKVSHQIAGITTSKYSSIAAGLRETMKRKGITPPIVTYTWAWATA